MRFAIVTECDHDAAKLSAALSHIPEASVVATLTGFNEVKRLCEDGEVDFIMAVPDAVVKGQGNAPALLGAGGQGDLSPREREVLALLGKGLSNRQISHILGVTERTTKAHVGNILSKLRLESRLQAGLLARTYLEVRA
ncbi:MAG TPA: helix-turn-helix transcriptional regulator [Streptosporangiaceae bacterium]